MKMHLSKAINELTELKKEKPSLQKALAEFSEIEEIPEEQKEYCQKKIIGYLNNIDHFLNTPNNYIFAASLLANNFSTQLGVSYLAKIIRMIPEPDLRHQLFWNMVRLNFTHDGVSKAEIFSAYLDMANSWKFDIPQINYSADFDCIILTSQLLSTKHAPTADTFSYYKILKKLNFKPLIINTDELPKRCGLPLINYIIANASISPIGLSWTQIDDVEIAIFTPGLDMPNPIGLGLISAIVSRVKPKFIISVANYSILQERLGAEYPLIIMPPSIEFTPSQTCTSVLFRKLSEPDRALIEQFSIDDSRILDGYTYNYELALVETVEYTRQQFALTLDDFVVCIVGNRLDDELDKKFIQFLSDVTKLGNNVKLFFVGSISPQTKAELKLSLTEHSVRFLHYSPDLVSVYKICDLYANPPRKGGGTSAAYCLAARVPVFSIRYGDVANILPDSFLMDSLDEMLVAIRGMLMSHDREAVKILAGYAFSKISNRTVIMSTILKQVGLV